MKIRQVGAELFHADGRTDRRTHMTQLVVAFVNFAKEPKKQYFTENIDFHSYLKCLLYD
jgi:hypothetical protein